jgi:hypothetical protein
MTGYAPCPGAPTQRLILLGCCWIEMRPETAMQLPAFFGRR